MDNHFTEKDQVYQEELKEKYFEFNTPFTASSFPKKIPRKDTTVFLSGLVKKGDVDKKKIGNMNIYWKKEIAATGSSGKEKKSISRVDSNFTGFKDRISELEDLLEEERVRNARLRKIDAIDEIDSEWEEVCYRMGEAIAHKAGLTLDAVLKQFGAPMDE